MERRDSRTRPTDSTAGGGSSGTLDEESVPSAVLVKEVLVMPHQEPRHGDPLGPRERARFVSFAPSAGSGWRGSVGMLAARYRDAPATEVEVPPSTHHSFILVHRPPEECEVRYEGVKRHVPPPAGSILVIPAGIPVRWRWA